MQHSCNMKKISILIPAYNEEATLWHTYRSICIVIDRIADYNWDFVFVDDGSSDHTLQILEEIRTTDRRVNILSLSRNFGKENAMLAGMDFADGDAVLIMDADGQHSLDILPQMVEEWENGADDVYAMRRERDTDGPMRRLLSRLYYRLLQSVSDINILPGAGDYRLLDHRCVEAISSMREANRYTKGLYCWIGFKKKGISYDHLPRTAGKSNFSYIRLFNLAINGITSHTVSPLRISSLIGCIVSVLAFVYLIYTVAKTLIYGEPVQGYPTIISAILFLGGLQLLSIGIIGEYLGRLFIESKHRPLYIIDKLNGEKYRTTNGRERNSKA